MRPGLVKWTLGISALLLTSVINAILTLTLTLTIILTVALTLGFPSRGS